MKQFAMTKQRLEEIEQGLGDDESGWLIKSSTLQWLIEREVNLELERRQETLSSAMRKLS